MMRLLHRLFRVAATMDSEAEFMDNFRVGAAAFARRALLTNCADEGLVIRMNGCHIRGEPWGDWEFTARRVAPASVDTRPKDEDALAASLASGAVPNEDSADAQRRDQ